jgi:hypothetical protein
MSKKKSTSVGFFLIGIETKQFAVYSDLYKPENEVMLSQKYDYGADDAEKMIGVLTDYRFTQNEVPFLSIQVLCHFKVEENAWNDMLTEEKSAITVEPGLLGHLVMLTIGTTRGVLHAKTENTPFNQYLLPTFNVNEIVTDAVTIEFEA